MNYNRRLFKFYKISIIVIFINILILLSCIPLLLKLSNIKEINCREKKDTNILTNINDNDNREKCYLSPDNSNIKIIHIIMTRFMIEFFKGYNFPRIIYAERYIKNGIRVMEKYLIPSLENQSCKNFVWIITLGNKANLTYIKTLFEKKNFSFKMDIIFLKETKNYIKNISKYHDVLITTRIDYDDQIYYDAVNDVRKAINLKKPILLYGYNRGVFYYEFENKYYDFDYTFKNKGASSIFLSLIIVINMVNDTYTIQDIGVHNEVKLSLSKLYKSFGIKYLRYEPAIFDIGSAKFVMVRQKYSGLYNYSLIFKNKLKPFNFNLTNFYGK